MDEQYITQCGTPVDIGVHQEDFDVGVLHERLRQHSRSDTGAIATFTGLVRDFTDQPDSSATLHLEHYPGMTERSLQAIAEEACARWPLLRMIVLHRVGELGPGDQIVYVGVSSSHRDAAFAAAEFVMDYLKTRAVFWKKELSAESETWVASKASDYARAADWESKD